MKVTQLKAKLQNIFANISQLEKLMNAGTTPHDLQQNLITSTNDLLRYAGKQTNRYLVEKNKKNQAKRRRRKKCKQKILTATVVAKKQTLKEDNLCSAEENPENVTASAAIAPPQPLENEYRQLKTYQEAQRNLQKFELLEMLHYARSHDKQLTREFHEKFISLRAIWNSVLLENTPKRTEARRIEDQWNEVIFGASEHTFYASGGKKTERERLREFLRIRHSWDSYLVRNKKHGSCIPLGWALPKNEISEMWEQYKI